jgi:DNA-directed RNA polymerase subunit F
MDSHDWTHTSVVRNSLNAEVRKQGGSVARFEEELKPIFAAMPKDAVGRVNNGTARYTLQRLFSQKYGWSVKGLQPAGAAWVATMSVTPDVKDVTKYMVPTYVQDLLLAQTGSDRFDIHALAIIASTIEHLAHSEVLSYVYSVFATLELQIPGKKTQDQVNEILDVFMMVHAFGLNLDVSVLADVQKAKEHLSKSHSGWSQLQAFARDVKQSAGLSGELDFDEIVRVATLILERYAQWQGKDCRRVKEELSSKPSHRDGRVPLSEVQPSYATGRRSLFTESEADLEKLGVLSKSSEGGHSELIISNYINSQSMCLSTASFYTACCMNECEGLLATLEREAAAPAMAPEELGRLMKNLPGPGISDSLLQEMHGLADPNSGKVQLHSRALASWMHKAFPLECPAPDVQHSQKVTNPKTPDEWIGDNDLQVQELEEMMGEIAQVLAQYTTMGKKAESNTGKQSTTVGKQVLKQYTIDVQGVAQYNAMGDVSADQMVSDPEADIIRLNPRAIQQQAQSGVLGFIGTLFRLAAMASMMSLVYVVGKSSIMATSNGKDKGLLKDFV